MEWIKIKDRKPPNNNGIPKVYGVENKDGKRDTALYGSSGAFNEPISFFEPQNRRFKASEIVRWCDLDFLK